MAHIENREMARIDNGGGEDSAAQPLQIQNLCISGKETPLSIAFHAANFAFIGLLIVFIQVKYPGSPTAFETHNVSMITSLISLCLYTCVIMLRMIVKAKDISCSLLIFNHTLLFSGILTPVSLLSVFLPYKPLWLMSFICALFSTILVHYLFQITKAAATSKLAHLRNFANGVVAIFTRPSPFTSIFIGNSRA